jgi:hypothetical protein
VIRGEHAPPPTRIIADTLPSLLPDARLKIVAGAGHMGPLTHPADVNPLIVRHIVETAVEKAGEPPESGGFLQCRCSGEATERAVQFPRA